MVWNEGVKFQTGSLTPPAQVEIFLEHNGMAGSPMITADLHDYPEFVNVSENRVARLMREMDLKRQTQYG